jgi:hypothetical protein
MSKKELPEILWANSVNLVGLFSKTPIRCIFNDEYPNIREALWENDKLDFSVSKIGLDLSDISGLISFSSINREEVEAWTNGVRAAHSLIYNNTKWGTFKK